MTHARAVLPTAQERAALPSDGGPKFNRLVFESSPYLLQHAANPVRWWPWGDAAFEEAKKQNKPVFLSIGYATCHWCHVMEHESFEDMEAAAALNDTFICIKVDREERPDVDHLYMTVCQAMNGHGGWPLTVLMTPDRKPFFTGTYFPKRARGGRVGVLELCSGIAMAWKEDRVALGEQAEQVARALNQAAPVDLSTELDGQALRSAAFGQLRARFDQRHGGFGRAPKFPQPHQLMFLLRVWDRTGDADALSMARRTLHAMRLGGVYDHVGFGVHRYSTDPEWLVPHFEKMLYDQALLVMSATELWLATKDDMAEQIAREVIEYVRRDMTDAKTGGFYCAEDADSEGEEGLFYTWTWAEMEKHLGAQDADLVRTVWNFEERGNFEEEATGHGTGRNIPHLREPLAAVADKLAKEYGEATEGMLVRLEALRAKLFAIRKPRIHPLKDDKILTDWNGLMIAALAKAAKAFDDEAYLAMATRAASFVWDTLRDNDSGELKKRYRVGETGLPATLEDYAFYLWGLTELAESDSPLPWLDRAIAVADKMTELFHDHACGGFYLSGAHRPDLIARMKETYDGAIPSGNSVAALALVRLARLTGRNAYEETASTALRSFAAEFAHQPMAHTVALLALDLLDGPTSEVVLCPGENSGRELRRAVHGRFLPRAVSLLRAEHSAEDDARLKKLAPFVHGMKTVRGQETAYVCKNQTCNAPTTDVAELIKALPHR